MRYSGSSTRFLLSHTRDLRVLFVVGKVVGIRPGTDLGYIALGEFGRLDFLTD